jgi:pimeloyl-ACP methyl ester carboxylesterase
MFDEYTLSGPAGTLNYALGSPSGPPLVLLHGVTRCWQDWSLLLPALAARWQVHALDFRGHGRSAPVPGHYHVHDYAEDAAALVRLCPAPPVVFGHSLGAMVALELAADPALKLRAIILEDPPFQTMGERILGTPLHRLFTGMRELLAETRDVPTLARGLARTPISFTDNDEPVLLGNLRDPTSLRFSARCLSRLDPEVLEPILAGEWLDEYDLDILLLQTLCPALLLQADAQAGGMLMEEDASTIVGHLKDCCWINFSGAGHLLHWTQTEEVLRMVTGFLESL